LESIGNNLNPVWLYRIIGACSKVALSNVYKDDYAVHSVVVVAPQKGRKTERQSDRERERQRDRETERQRDRGTERQRDRKTERQRDRETERKKERDK
jgi:hypothetical protein